MDNRTRRLLLALREIAIQLLAALEDYLDVAYDKSALAKRRKKLYGEETAYGT